MRISTSETIVESFKKKDEISSNKRVSLSANEMLIEIKTIVTYTFMFKERSQYEKKIKSVFLDFLCMMKSLI